MRTVHDGGGAVGDAEMPPPADSSAALSATPHPEAAPSPLNKLVKGAKGLFQGGKTPIADHAAHGAADDERWNPRDAADKTGQLAREAAAKTQEAAMTTAELVTLAAIKIDEKNATPVPQTQEETDQLAQVHCAMKSNQTAAGKLEREMITSRRCCRPIGSVADTVAIISMGGESQHYLLQYEGCGIMTPAILSVTLIALGLAISTPALHTFMDGE